MQKAHHSGKKKVVLECIKLHWSYYQDGWLALLQNHITGCGPQPPHLQGVVSLNLQFYNVCYLHTNSYTVTLCIDTVITCLVIALTAAHHNTEPQRL